MTALGAIFILLSAITSGLVFNAIRQWYRLSHIPGPFSTGFSQIWMARQALLGRQPMALKEANDKYGSLIRVGPNDVITDDPSVLRRMNGVRSAYDRGPWYDSMRFDGGKDSIVSVRGAYHDKLRYKMAGAYSGKESEAIEANVDLHVSKFIQLIENKYISTSDVFRPMDFAQKAQYFTLDVISDLAFSHAFGYLEADDDLYDYVKLTRAYIPVMVTFANIPSLARMIQSPIFRGLLPKSTDKLGFGAFMGIVTKVVAKRLGPLAESKPDMLGSFMRHGLTDEEAPREGLVQVLAGSDSSATTIRYILLYLLATPTAYNRLQREIDEGIAAGTISSPVRNTEARDLPYLQAVIREGLRIRPPASGAFFKTVPPGGDTINGKFLPGGTQLGSSSFSIHHSKRVFGEDAESFIPERWLTAEPGRLAEMTSTADLVFHSGKWQCLGKPVALMEFNKMFVELLRRYNFSLVNPEKPATTKNAGIWVVEDFWVRVTRRETVESH
ncbi:cytochrome P450 [Stachybotrys elegans]|uniref:Cytochrome P450 monooxygenase ABA1 n=1 Tax=Stachybotrys elegans TaxID=80388 RepID=A0A8K0T935_9HYPO|nr:cytochrome P450 [Stachybotrys elegans]